MPIVGDGPTVGGPPTWYNVSEYSHSTVVTITRPYKSENAPPLSTAWIPPVECKNRWMLVDNGAPGDTAILSSTTFVQSIPAIGSTISRLPQTLDTPLGMSTPSAPPQKAIVVVKRQKRDFITDHSPNSQSPSIARAFQFTAWSIDSNPLYTSCQPYSDQPLYSPGVCPEGQTIAEVTEIHANVSTGVRTEWQASCCSR